MRLYRLAQDKKFSYLSRRLPPQPRFWRVPRPPHHRAPGGRDVPPLPGWIATVRRRPASLPMLDWFAAARQGPPWLATAAGRGRLLDAARAEGGGARP